MKTTEKLLVEHVCKKFIYKAFHIHDEDNEFTGITKIERHAIYAGKPHTIVYAFHGCVYAKLDDAVAEFKKIGRQVLKRGK